MRTIQFSNGCTATVTNRTFQAWQKALEADAKFHKAWNAVVWEDHEMGLSEALEAEQAAITAWEAFFEG